MARAKTKASELRGPSIYQGEKPGTLFYDKFCKDAYIIQNNDAYKYDDYKTYLVIGTVLAIAAGLYGKFNPLITLIIITLVLSAGRIVFQKKCLDYCITIKFKPIKKIFFLKLGQKYKDKEFIIIIALSIFLIVLSFYNMKKFAEEEFLKTGYLLIAIGTGIFLICAIISLIIKQNDKR